MNESLLQLRALVLAPTFLPVAAVLALLAAATYFRRGRSSRVLWALSLVAVVVAVVLGVLPGPKGPEWREVLFNGQLL